VIKKGLVLLHDLPQIYLKAAATHKKFHCFFHSEVTPERRIFTFGNFCGHTVNVSLNFSRHLHYSPMTSPLFQHCYWKPHFMSTSSQRTAIGSKKLFATGPQAAMRQHHDIAMSIDCTVHKEPAMLPSLKHGS